jgi:replicative DNA helicase
VRSLGGVSIVKTYDRTKDGKPIEFHVNIRMSICPFHAKRKASQWKPTNPSRYIFNVEPSRCVEQVCISVDSDDGLYVTDDYIITHNTALLLNLLENAAREGLPVGVFSCEMSEKQLGYRLAARRTNVSVQRMINGMLSPDESRRIVEATNDLAFLPIYVDDRGGLKDMDIIKASRRMIRNHGVRMIGIDYLQGIDPANSVGRENEDIGRMCKNFKNMAKSLEIPVILLAQLNRRVEDRVNKRPILSDLKSSGDIEQEADIVIFIYRDDYYDKESVDIGIAEIDFAKYRNGRTGMIRMAWNGVGQVFTDLAKEE